MQASEPQAPFGSCRPFGLKAPSASCRLSESKASSTPCGSSEPKAPPASCGSSGPRASSVSCGSFEPKVSSGSCESSGPKTSSASCGCPNRRRLLHHADHLNKKTLSGSCESSGPKTSYASLCESFEPKVSSMFHVKHRRREKGFHGKRSLENAPWKTFPGERAARFSGRLRAAKAVNLIRSSRTASVLMPY